MVNELLRLNHIRNVIFDMDGTLIDSNDAHARSFIEAFELNGVFSIQFRDIRKLIGMSGTEILRHMLDEETFKQKGGKINADRIRIFEQSSLNQVKPLPGFLPLMELMKAHGMRMALSSSSPRHLVDSIIGRLGIQSLIEGATSAEDVPEGKPNPVAIEACCQKFGFSPTETLMIGDSPYDMIAAQLFSIKTIGVLTGGYTEEELEKSGAAVVYPDLNAIYQIFEKAMARI